MTDLRDQIAIAVLPALIAEANAKHITTDKQFTRDALSETAYQFADSMARARETSFANARGETS